MSQLIPFEGGNLPAYLQGAAEPSNDDLLSHASTSFPIISIKGKVFTVSREGEKKVLPNPKDPQSPATRIQVAVVKVNKGTSKVFYASGYTEGSDSKPDCFSNDGIRPDPSVEHPINPVCATCPKNQWGSRTGDGGKKGKACSDSVRIAVSVPNQINDPYFVRVPAASIKNLGEFGKQLTKRKVPYQAVVTEIAFDVASPTPLLTFKPVAFLTDSQYAEVKEVAASDVVQAIMGSQYTEDENAPAAPAPTAAPAPAPAKATPKPTPKPTPAPAPVVTQAEVVEAVEAAEPAADAGFGGFDLDNITFDD